MMAKKEQIYRYTLTQINRLESQRSNSSGRAALAKLRRGIGHEPGELPVLWGEFLSGLPEELRSTSGAPSRAEWAIYTALTLYAMHQQGKTDSVQVADVSLGHAAMRMVGGEEERQRIWRRLNLVAQADDMQEMCYRLRQLVSLFRSEGVGLDYALLAADLYQYQFEDSANQVRLRWGQDFFHYTNKDDEEAIENE